MVNNSVKLLRVMKEMNQLLERHYEKRRDLKELERVFSGKEKPSSPDTLFGKLNTDEPLTLLSSLCLKKYKNHFKN